MKRYVLRTVLKCLTALQVGALEQVPATDKCTARDGIGRLFVPGTTYAGVLRNIVRMSFNDKIARTLFGFQDDEDGQRSAILVDHGYILTDLAPEIRDFVRIDRKSGTAEDHKKFDWEILPAGTEISLRLEYVDYDKVWKEEEKKESLDSFLQLAKFLRVGHEWQIGAGYARGTGRVKSIEDNFAMWSFHFPDLQNANDYFALLRAESTLDKWSITPEQATQPLDSKALDQLLVETDNPIKQGITIDLELEAQGPFIIGAGEYGDDWDIVPYSENDQKIVPGSSFRGAMRQRAERIVNTVLQSKYQPNKYQIGDITNDWARIGEVLVEPLFGSVERASYIGVSDSGPLTGHLQPIQSVTIDRFTGGAREARLFSSEVFWSQKQPLRLNLRITLRPDLTPENKNGVLGLLAHVLYDLGSGDLPVGRAKTSGHGIFRALSLQIKGLDSQEIKIGQNEINFSEAKIKFKDQLDTYQTSFLTWLDKRTSELKDPEQDQKLMLQPCQESN